MVAIFGQLRAGAHAHHLPVSTCCPKGVNKGGQWADATPCLQLWSGVRDEASCLSRGYTFNHLLGYIKNWLRKPLEPFAKEF